jgi:hypothetical protein
MYGLERFDDNLEANGRQQLLNEKQRLNENANGNNGTGDIIRESGPAGAAGSSLQKDVENLENEAAEIKRRKELAIATIEKLKLELAAGDFAVCGVDVGGQGYASGWGAVHAEQARQATKITGSPVLQSAAAENEDGDCDWDV